MRGVWDRVFIVFVPAIAAAMILGGGLIGRANAQSTCPPASSLCFTPPPSTDAPPSEEPLPGEPLGAATHAAIRSQSDAIGMVLSDYLRWRLRGMAQSASPAGSGQATDGLIRGMSAGSPMQNLVAWGDASASYLKNDTTAFANEGYGVTGLVGLDSSFNQNWLFGFSAGYARTQLKVKALAGDKLEHGAVLGPYLSYIINPHLAVDASFTYGRLSNSFPGASSFDADRFTGAANLDLFADAGGSRLSGSIGYLYAYESPTASGVPTALNGFPTTQRYGAIKLSGEVAYPIGNFEPYLPIAYTYETTRPVDAVGHNTLTLGVGLRYRMSDSLNAGLQATDDEFRSHSRDETFSASLRWSF